MSDLEKLNIFSPCVLQRIAEIGFLASEYGFHEKAEQIFLGMALAKPDSSAPAVSLAVVHARSGRLQDAITGLKHAAGVYPASEMVKAMLGAFLVEARQDGALELFEAVLASRQEPGAVNIVECWLDQARKLREEGSARRTDTGSLAFFRHHNIRP